jgi:hypothetical protein
MFEKISFDFLCLKFFFGQLLLSYYCNLNEMFQDYGPVDDFVESLA